MVFHWQHPKSHFHLHCSKSELVHQVQNTQTIRDNFVRRTTLLGHLGVDRHAQATRPAAAAAAAAAAASSPCSGAAGRACPAASGPCPAPASRPRPAAASSPWPAPASSVWPAPASSPHQQAVCAQQQQAVRAQHQQAMTTEGYTWRLPCHPESTFADVATAKIEANRFAREHGYALVVKSVCRDRNGAHRRVVLGCDRHGRRKPYVSRGLHRRVNAASRRCGCLMELNIVRSGEAGTSSERWSFEHRGKAIKHNHPPSSHASAHPVHRRAARTSDVVESIVADAEIGIRAAQTTARLNLEGTGTAILQRDIYNERRRAVNERVGGMTRMEYLLMELQNGDYFVEFETDEANRVTHLFFAYGPAIAVFQDNNDVVQLDCTYRTNRFGMPLLNIVGVSGSNMTVHIGQAFLRKEEKGIATTTEDDKLEWNPPTPSVLL